MEGSTKMRSKIKRPNEQIKLTLSIRQRREIQRSLGYHFEATITKEGLLLHSNKQKYSLKQLLAKLDLTEFG